jgi:diacylglycerol kinase (ATP)
VTRAFVVLNPDAGRGRPDGFEEALEVLVLNSGVLGDPSIRWARDIQIDDGQLDLCVVTVKDALDYARVGIRLLFGRSRLAGRSAARCFPVRRQVTIRTGRSRRVQADGDVIGQTPVTIELIPNAIDILVPAEPGGDGPDQ